LPQIKEVMPQFNKLKVQTVVNETGDSVSVSFEVPDSLLVNYQFQPGQDTTLRLNINGEMVNRSYSFCSSPYAGEPMTIAVKRVQGGKASNHVND
jgi:ring-1,2-phenylacetyl-CoA epoxidase subunit PaaE